MADVVGEETVEVLKVDPDGDQEVKVRIPLPLPSTPPHVSVKAEIEDKPLPKPTESGQLQISAVKRKDREIRQLKMTVDRERRLRLETEAKLKKLADFFMFVQGEFGKLVGSIAALTSVQEETGSLTLGPFQDDSEAEEFMEMLQDLAKKYQNDLKDLASTKDLLERANLILTVKTTPQDPPEATLDDNLPKIIDVRSLPKPDFQLDPFVAELLGTIPSTPSPVRHRKRPRNAIPPILESSNEFHTAKKKHGIDLTKKSWGFYCLCGIRTSNATALQAHISHFTANENKPKCPICGKVYSYQASVRNHVAKVHGNGRVGGGGAAAGGYCATCFQGFPTRDELIRHRTSCEKSTLTLQPGRIEKRAPPPPPPPLLPLQNAQQPAVPASQPAARLETLQNMARPVFRPNIISHGFPRQRSSFPVMAPAQQLEVPKMLSCSLCSGSFGGVGLLKQHYRVAHNMVSVPERNGHRVPVPEQSGHQFPVPQRSGHQFPVPQRSGQRFSVPQRGGHQFPVPQGSGHRFPAPQRSGHRFPVTRGGGVKPANFGVRSQPMPKIRQSRPYSSQMHNFKLPKPTILQQTIPPDPLGDTPPQPTTESVQRNICRRNNALTITPVVNGNAGNKESEHEVICID